MTWVQICYAPVFLVESAFEEGFVARRRCDRLERKPLSLFDMQKLFTMMGMTVGGYIGWAIGAPVGIFTAFMVSMVGTAAGLYAARRLADRFLP